MILTREVGDSEAIHLAALVPAAPLPRRLTQNVMMWAMPGSIARVPALPAKLACGSIPAVTERANP